MEKIKKFLRRLSKEERQRVEDVVRKIVANDFDALDLKKLKGHSDVYRIRVGGNRVIFRRMKSNNVILEISRRNDTTYK